jgi:aerobic carbon-monoxide dehydrogenase medium subunit
MIPASFGYVRANTAAEAVGYLKENPDAKILAGGHSLIPAMKFRLSQPSTLIDIARIPELNFIRDRGKYIAIGAATTHGTIEHHKTTTMKLPLLSHVASMIGDIQVRNKGTIGGSIAHADPSADWPAVLIVANATIEVLGPYGEQRIPADEFFTGFFSTKLDMSDVITEIHVPEPDAKTLRYAYEKFAQPASRFAVVGCAIQLTMDGDIVQDARVAFNGVSDHAYRAISVENELIGKPLSEDSITAASNNAATEAAMILSDHFADEAYRRHLAVVYCKRAIMKCWNAD